VIGNDRAVRAVMFIVAVVVILGLLFSSVRFAF
jgi:hypothetical protein